MPEIGHIRIDDRLIHGQIVASWISALGTKTIVVADDTAAADPLQTTLLAMAVPPSVALEVLPVEKAAAWLKEAGDTGKVLVIVRNPAGALALAKQGIVPKEINVGNISASPAKTKYSKSVWLDDADKAQLTELKEMGVYLEVRVVPGEKGVDLFSML